jgi:hypothetical protein
MAFINKQAALVTLAAASNEIYTAPTDAQIRALTVHNPTETNIDLVVTVGGVQILTKTIVANSTEVLSQLFNQQLKKTEILTMTGDGANVMLTVVEITE